MSYKNRNDFFYQLVFNQLKNLNTYYPEIEFTDDIDETKSPSICIAIDDETKGQDDQNYKNIINRRKCNFEIYYFERVPKKKLQAKDIRDRQFKMIDLIESELRKINKLSSTNKTYEYKHPITNIAQYEVSLKDVEITDTVKTLPQNDNDTYYIYLKCEFEYQQRLYNIL